MLFQKRKEPSQELTDEEEHEAMMKLAKAQKPEFGQFITNKILDETDERKTKRGEGVKGQPKEREQINSSHETYVRRRPVPSPQCQAT